MVGSVEDVRCVVDLEVEVGEKMVSHAGLHMLGSFGDVLGLSEAFSEALPYEGPGTPVYDRGVAKTQMMLVLAGGGEACSDIEYLRSEPELFGDVPATTTMHRIFLDADDDKIKAESDAFSVPREKVWDRIGVRKKIGGKSGLKGDLTLDIDASVHVVHSENKENANANYKGYGFHPLYCMADVTGETLNVLLRPGNAAPNTIKDHEKVLDASVKALGGDLRGGAPPRRRSEPGESPDKGTHRLSRVHPVHA